MTKTTDKAKATRSDAKDHPIAEVEPNWDRMGEIADRLLSTPPDRQAVGKALGPKKKSGKT